MANTISKIQVSGVTYDIVDESKLISITYSDLVTLKGNSGLTVGAMYRITDYVTTTAQENTQSANHPFDVIVTATDVDTLNENAMAIKHSGDSYFADSDLNAWEIKYDINNDTDKYAWADSTNGKGVIYYMKDEFGNECPYDFKNIMFKRFRLANQNGLHLADYPMKDSEYSGGTQTAFNTWKAKLGTFITNDNIAFYYVKGVYLDGYVVNGAEIYDYTSDYESYDNGNLTFDETSEGNYVGVSCVYDWFDVIAEVADTNGEWFYTFSKKATTAATATDASTDIYCYENSIKPYLTNGIITLNDNIFIVPGASLAAYGNTFGTNNYNMTFGNNSYGNSFGNNSYGNSFGNNSYGNSFGNDCRYNSFGNSCSYNSFGNNCSYNSFGNSCCSNSFGDGCGSNTFGNSCASNSFGNYCYSNSFGNSCGSTTFGNYCSYNSFGNYCWYNSFVNGSYNSFGNRCSYNSFEDDCNSNTFGDDCESNTFGNDCNSNTFGNDCYSNTVWDYCNSNTFGNDCYNNSLFRLNCSYNSFGNYCQHIRILKDYFYSNIVENGNQYIDITSTQTTSPSNILRNITIAQGVNNSSPVKTISHDSVNDTFKTTYQAAASTVVNI